MSISVVVVTYNRQEEVKMTIRSLMSQTNRPLEIIVIDDNSNPSLTLESVDPVVKIIRTDEELGISRARNYGVKIAKGDYIAFIDDDALASKHWIAAIQQGIQEGAEVLGGPLIPRYRSKPPSWWSEKDLGYFVGVGNSERTEIWGANMVFKRTVFEKIGYFNPMLGSYKGKRLNGEDTFSIAKARAHFKVMFIPEANVFHSVKSSRLTLTYIIKWSYVSGKSQRIASGPGKLAFFYFVKAMLEFFNPFSKIGKSGRIHRIAIMVEQIGCII
jgi:GT2 family glycosyltransferase